MELNKVHISKEAYELLCNHAKTLDVHPNDLLTAVFEYALEHPELIQKIIRKLKGSLENEV